MCAQYCSKMVKERTPILIMQNVPQSWEQENTGSISKCKRISFLKPQTVPLKSAGSSQSGYHPSLSRLGNDQMIEGAKTNMLS